MSNDQITEKKPIRKDPYKKEQGGCYKTAGWIFRGGLLLLVMVVCLTASLVLYARWLNSGQGGVRFEGGSPTLNPVEQLYLQTYLAARAEQLQMPVGTGVTAVPLPSPPAKPPTTSPPIWWPLAWCKIANCSSTTCATLGWMPS
ncbi:MAG: hypothetical protein HC804_05050 [Anaerolineae bacterium]|nr:hypothetical protein [Anaerolineae bacterium]